jgi:hypothetical protein
MSGRWWRTAALPMPVAAGTAALMVFGVAGCTHQVSSTPLPTAADGDRLCRLVSRQAVRTLAGDADPTVRDPILNLDPQAGWLLDAGCVIQAGDVNLNLSVDWVSASSDRQRIRADLGSPPSGAKALAFAAADGTGYLHSSSSGARGVTGSLLRGQYRLQVTLTGVPEPRDPYVDAQALLLQAAHALAISPDETAPRPKAPA